MRYQSYGGTKRGLALASAGAAVSQGYALSRLWGTKRGLALTNDMAAVSQCMRYQGYGGNKTWLCFN